MDADGSNVRQLSDVVGSDWAFVRVDWSHDGTKIVGQAGAADDIANWDIWVINADGSGATNVGAHPQGIDEIIPSWAPDRDALAWCRRTASSCWRKGPIRSTSRGRTASPFGRPTASSSRDHGCRHRRDGPRWHRPDDRRRPRGRLCLATPVRIAATVQERAAATAPSPSTRHVVVGEVRAPRPGLRDEPLHQGPLRLDQVHRVVRPVLVEELAERHRPELRVAAGAGQGLTR